jgi:hypothetical protein
VDSGYVTIANLVESQSSYRVDLVGPTLKTHWYQAETGYDLTHFCLDWEAETVTSTGTDQFELDTGSRCRQIAHQSEVFSE